MSEEFTHLSCKQEVEGLNGKSRSCGADLFELQSSADGRVRIKCSRCGHSTEFWVTGGGPVED